MPDTYLPSMSLDAYLRTIASDHAQLSSLIDRARLREVAVDGGLAACDNEFESDATGRGDSYRRAQQDASVRWTGARRLLELAAPAHAAGDATVLDVLGGDGTIARALTAHGDGASARLRILTGDISGAMVERALAYGLSALRQSAEALILRDDSVSAVLLAYGTHHIAPERRPLAIAEAVRVARPGGRVVVHDFDDSSPMAGFFGEVVHSYSAVGHPYEHFSRARMVALFDGLDVPVSVSDVYDPLIVRAETEDEARRRMCDYLADMYGIHAFFAQLDRNEAWHRVRQHFDHTAYLAGTDAPPGTRVRPTTYRVDGGYAAEVPRMALAAVATKAPA
ncbi:methyltransferase domain-containing protein [Kitasatospora sp. NPDC091335]|uniref:methyltransferase domain-containing protein n=1 Tax=Kitasatospora sp. NPDC091335 TaxID=3364085 RepID=UPI0037F42B7F